MERCPSGCRARDPHVADGRAADQGGAGQGRSAAPAASTLGKVVCGHPLPTPDLLGYIIILESLSQCAAVFPAFWRSATNATACAAAWTVSTSTFYLAFWHEPIGACVNGTLTSPAIRTASAQDIAPYTLPLAISLPHTTRSDKDSVRFS